MLGFLSTLITIILVALAQISILPQLALWGVFPNMIVVILITLILAHKTNEALWFALGCGIILDLFSVNAFGLNIITLLSTVAACLGLKYLIGTHFSSLIERLVVAASAVLIYFTISNILIFVFGLFSTVSVNYFSWHIIMRYDLLGALFTLILALLLIPFIISVIQRWTKFIGSKTTVTNS